MDNEEKIKLEKEKKFLEEERIKMKAILAERERYLWP
jgi:hypothetical protein